MDVHGLRWADIARHMEGRTDQQCMGRWRRHLDPAVKRESWSTGEDRRLAELRVAHGANWSAIARRVENRTAQQCRARWFQAHFTGHVYLDANGTLLSKKECDVLETEVDLKKAEALKSGKSLRPNGVKAAAAHAEVENVMKAKGVVKEEKVKSVKKRNRGKAAGVPDDETDEAKRRRLARDASGRFAPKDDKDDVVDVPLVTPATTPGKQVVSMPPLLRKKPPRQVASETDTLPYVPASNFLDSENNNPSGPGPARTLSLNLTKLVGGANQVTLPPDVAEFMAKQAALDDEINSPTAADVVSIDEVPESLPVLKDLAARLPRNGSSFMLGVGGVDVTKPSDAPFDVVGAGLATMNSGDWGAMLGGDIGSVAAMLETASAAMAEEMTRIPTLGNAKNMDSFKLAIAQVAATTAR